MHYLDDKRQKRQISKNQRARFIEQYMLCLDEKLAAQRIGLPPEVGVGLMKSRQVQNSVAFFRMRRSVRTDIYEDEVLRRWWQLAGADARELVAMWRVACRYCWGIDHRYQYRDPELQRLRQKHMISQLVLPSEARVEFDDEGGGGYSENRDPCRSQKFIDKFAETVALSGVSPPIGMNATSDHDCPSCDGYGELSVKYADTRYLSPAAALLYNGVEVGKDGSLKLQLRDRDAALNMVAKHLGMVVNRQAIHVFQPERMTDEQLEGAIRAFDRLLGPPDVEGEVVEQSQEEK